MSERQPPMPHLWLVSDARNDAMLERALRRLPRGSGLIFRHAHLAPRERRMRFAALRRLAHGQGHRIVLAGSPVLARAWGADGAYGPAARLLPRRAGLRLATAHDLREIGAAWRAGADAVLLSPIFATASHPGGRVLGPLRFRLVAAQSAAPVIALGGMTRARARRLRVSGWAAIDGLSGGRVKPIDAESPSGA